MYTFFKVHSNHFFLKRCSVLLLIRKSQNMRHCWFSFLQKPNLTFSETFIFFILFYWRKIPDGRYVDVRKPSTFVNFRPHEETVFIVHGFNGTARDKHMRYLKDGNVYIYFYLFHLFANWFILHFFVYFSCMFSSEH